MFNILKHIPGTLAHSIEKEKLRAAEREANIRRRSVSSSAGSTSSVSSSYGDDGYGVYAGLAASGYGYSGDSCSSSSSDSGGGGGDGGGGGGCD